MTSVIIDKRYCGPPNSGNGGYVCGRLARHIPGGAEVTLRAPPPLDKQLDVIATDDGLWELRDGATVVATGRLTSLELTRLEKASFDEACAAELLTPVKPHEHPLPTCFVCGPARAQGDGDGPGDVTLNFVDTDLHDVAHSILGDVLHLREYRGGSPRARFA